MQSVGPTVIFFAVIFWAFWALRRGRRIRPVIRKDAIVAAAREKLRMIRERIQPPAAPACNAFAAESESRNGVEQVLVADAGYTPGYTHEVKLKFRIGQWVRFEKKDVLYAGRLARVGKVRCWEKEVIYGLQVDPQGLTEAFETWLEPAVPQYGEWWRNDLCNAHSITKSESFFIFYQKPDLAVRPFFQARVRCGCLTPVNFGKGPEGPGAGA